MPIRLPRFAQLLRAGSASTPRVRQCGGSDGNKYPCGSIAALTCSRRAPLQLVQWLDRKAVKIQPTCLLIYVYRSLHIGVQTECRSAAYIQSLPDSLSE